MLLLTYYLLTETKQKCEEKPTDWIKPHLECVDFKREDLLDGFSGFIPF